MTITEKRKRRFRQDPPSKLSPGIKATDSEKITSVFFLYDRESVKDRELIQRLYTTIEKGNQVKCSILDGKPGWVLRSYEEELEAADKVVVLFSADFISSEEASFVFEMARSLCMNRRENKIIIASKSSRKLPKAYDGFPRVKMSKKSWIEDLVKEVKKPVIQVSANSWTFNKAGYKAVNIQELYKECENKTSISMPTLECLERPPTLPKSVVDKFLIWNRFKKGPKLQKGLGRTESQRTMSTFDFENFTKIRKASSFSKDRDTMEFITRSCRRSRGNRINRKSSCSSRPSSGVYVAPPLPSPPNSPQWSENGVHGYQKYTCQSPLLTPSTQADNHREESECDKSKTGTQHITESEQAQVHHSVDNCCKKKRLDDVMPIPPGIHSLPGNGHCRRHSNVAYCPVNTTLAAIITTFVEAMRRTTNLRIPEGQTTDLQSSDLETDCGSSSPETVSVTPTVTTGQTFCQTDLLAKVIPVQNVMIEAPVTEYVNLPEDPRLKRFQSRLVSNLDEAEFDNALCEKPEEFRTVTFDHEHGDFIVNRGETVWVKPLTRHKTVCVRKRNGLTGHIPRILLRPYIDVQVDSESGSSESFIK